MTLIIGEWNKEMKGACMPFEFRKMAFLVEVTPFRANPLAQLVNQCLSSRWNRRRTMPRKTDTMEGITQ
jgi:hypothetical protein